MKKALTNKINNNEESVVIKNKNNIGEISLKENEIIFKVNKKEVNRLSQLKDLVDHSVSTPISVTYAQLYNLYNTSKLKQGQSYIITDYQTVHTITNTTDTNTGSIEPIIVTAININKLSPVAYSTLYPQDILYYNIINDVDVVPGCTKGYIYKRIDTKQNNEFNFDFRNVKFRRWSINQPTWDNSTQYSVGNVVKNPLNNELYMSMQDNINTTLENSNVWFLLKMAQYDNYLTNSDYYMGNTVIYYWSESYIDYYVYGSNISEYANWTNNIFNSHTFSDIILSNNNVIRVSYCSNNNINGSFYNNTVINTYSGFLNNELNIFELSLISGDFNNNIIKGTCYYLIINNFFNDNNIGKVSNFSYHYINSFYKNVVHDAMMDMGASYMFGNLSNNVFNMLWFDNTIISYNTYMTNNFIEGEFTNNKINAYNFSYNKINKFNYNQITGYEFSFNSIGFDFSNNNVIDGLNIQYNTFGVSCLNNTITASEIKNNKIGNEFSNNVITNGSIQYNTIGDNCNNFNIASSQPGAISFTFSNNVVGAGNTNLIIQVNYFVYNKFGNSCDELNIYCEAFSNNIFGNNFSYNNLSGSSFQFNIFNDNCQYNTIGETGAYISYNNFGSNFNTNILKSSTYSNYKDGVNNLQIRHSEDCYFDTRVSVIDSITNNVYFYKTNFRPCVNTITFPATATYVQDPTYNKEIFKHSTLGNRLIYDGTTIVDPLS